MTLHNTRAELVPESTNQQVIDQKQTMLDYVLKDLGTLISCSEYFCSGTNCIIISIVYSKI
jgi:hypothetical protein